VQLVNGRVIANGRLLNEPYARVDPRVSGPNKEYHLEDGYYFVIGDNRPVSVFRAIPERYILGKVVF
jgi:hypothetical protein